MPPATGLLGVGCDTAALAAAVAAQWPGGAVREARVARDAAAVREAVERWVDTADGVAVLSPCGHPRGNTGSVQKWKGETGRNKILQTCFPSVSAETGNLGT